MSTKDLETISKTISKKLISHDSLRAYGSGLGSVVQVFNEMFSNVVSKKLFFPKNVRFFCSKTSLTFSAKKYENT